jgi:hypothetical protein
MARPARFFSAANVLFTKENRFPDKGNGLK